VIARGKHANRAPIKSFAIPRLGFPSTARFTLRWSPSFCLKFFGSSLIPKRRAQPSAGDSPTTMARVDAAIRDRSANAHCKTKNKTKHNLEEGGEDHDGDKATACRFKRVQPPAFLRSSCFRLLCSTHRPMHRRERAVRSRSSCPLAIFFFLGEAIVAVVRSSCGRC